MSRAGRDRLQFALPGFVGSIDLMGFWSCDRSGFAQGGLVNCSPRPHLPTDRGVANSHLTSAESDLTIALAADRVMNRNGIVPSREACAIWLSRGPCEPNRDRLLEAEGYHSPADALPAEKSTVRVSFSRRAFS